MDADLGPLDDPGVTRVDRAANDAERLQIEAQLLEQTDNRPRPQDGEQPSQEAEGPRGLGVRDRILARARSQLGIHENPFGSNRTPYSRWYGLVGPWCAMFVSWCFLHGGLPLPASTSKGFAYTPVGAAWFRRQGRWTRRPQVGAVIFFDFPGDGIDRISHVGIVERVNPDGSVICLEGNTTRRAAVPEARSCDTGEQSGSWGTGFPATAGRSRRRTRTPRTTPPATRSAGETGGPRWLGGSAS